MNDNQEHDIDKTLLKRAYDEYIEMPGLHLTVAQASRLWDVKPERACHALYRLVATTFLRRIGDCYERVDCGRMCA